MSFTRRPRFRRSSEVAPIRLTERDYNMLAEIHQHRFLRSPQIIALVGGSYQQGLRRLHLLFHHGYVERPRCQIDYYNNGGSQTMIYGLSSRGYSAISHKIDLPTKSRQWSWRYAAVTRLFLNHAVMVSDIMVALRLACRKNTDFRLIAAHEFHHKTSANNQLSWTAHVPNIGEVRMRLEKPPEVSMIRREGSKARASAASSPVNSRSCSGLNP